MDKGHLASHGVRKDHRQALQIPVQALQLPLSQAKRKRREEAGEPEAQQTTYMKRCQRGDDTTRCAGRHGHGLGKWIWQAVVIPSMFRTMQPRLTIFYKIAVPASTPLSHLASVLDKNHCSLEHGKANLHTTLQFLDRSPP